MSELPFSIPAGRWSGFKGYRANPQNCPEDMLSSPSINCMVDRNGNVVQRLGFIAENIDLGLANKSVTAFYHEKYDVTVFAGGTSVKYYDWTRMEVIDTGITLTNGTVTRFDAYEGDVYLTNTTDGVYRLIFGRLNDASPNSGDATFTIDSDMAAHLTRFSLTSGNIRIRGTNEAYASLVIATGVVTHSTTLSQNYANDDICIRVEQLSSLEKFSKIVFWKERMTGIGVLSGSNSDGPASTVFFGKFTPPDTLENINDFTYAAGGSTREMVGRFGAIKNILPVKDFLYAFKESQSYAAAASEVITSGTGIGGTPFDLRDENNGCLNEDSACSTGNNEMSWIANNRRIMGTKIATDTGAAVTYSDEGYDLDIQEDLVNMDSNQSGARSFYYQAGHLSIHQIRILGSWYWYIKDNRTGKWQPPQQVIYASAFFERKGILYVIGATDDTIYSVFFNSTSDNGNPIYCLVATGDFDLDDASVNEVKMQGLTSPAAKLRLKCFVTSDGGGKQTTDDKIIDGSSYAYGPPSGVGFLGVGGSTAPGVLLTLASWKKTYDVFPSEANRIQALIEQYEVGGYFSLSKFGIKGIQYSESLTASL